jgi:hypothetical protein
MTSDTVPNSCPLNLPGLPLGLWGLLWGVSANLRIARYQCTPRPKPTKPASPNGLMDIERY